MTAGPVFCIRLLAEHGGGQITRKIRLAQTAVAEQQQSVGKLAAFEKAAGVLSLCLVPGVAHLEAVNSE